MKRHGYSRVTAVCKKAGGDWVRLREELRKAFPDDTPKP
jgi:IS5 family transposase